MPLRHALSLSTFHILLNSDKITGTRGRVINNLSSSSLAASASAATVTANTYGYQQLYVDLRFALMTIYNYMHAY